MATVLVVEDERSAAEVLAALLKLEGFKVALAPNGRRAMEILSDLKPQLIITDYMMPIMNGIEMAAAVRAIPEYATVPILMTSGVPEEAVQKHASLLSGFLRKPFRVEALLAAVTRLMAHDGAAHKR